MRNFFLAFLLGLVFTSFAQQSPLQQRIASSNDSRIYDQLAWSFATDAPIRATPLLAGGKIFLGNARGEFYAIDRKTGNPAWKFKTGSAIHSSAMAAGDLVYFSDNEQALYALEEKSGKQRWKFNFGKKLDYPWRFDYYYSSPVFHGGKIYIGGDDGYFYAIDARTGKVFWKYRAEGIIRSTPLVDEERLYFGDTEAGMYCLDSRTGAFKWKFRINGDTMRNEQYGFDRRAITSSPVRIGNKLLFGARDGWLYCIDAISGKPIWKMDHQVSWVISTVAVRDSIVVTGTSDGRFIQAVHLQTGRELWKTKTGLAVWSSPLIIGDKVYAGSFDGHVYCLDLTTGGIVSKYQSGGKIMSSPVWGDGRMFVGSDDGRIYAFEGREAPSPSTGPRGRYVYYEEGVNVYFRGNAGKSIRNYLVAAGCQPVGRDSLEVLISAKQSATIIFASCYFPPSITKGGGESPLRQFLERGGRVILPGTNPLLYRIDEKTLQPFAFSPHVADTILGIDYGPGDTRTFMGEYPAFPTSEGLRYGLPGFWTNSLFIKEGEADIVLGKNENGDVSAFARNYSNGGQFIQVWLNNEHPERMDCLLRLAEGVK